MAASLKKMCDQPFIYVFTFCLISLVCVAVLEAKQKHVTVTLDAKWNSSPVILEASEYLAKENNEYFWRFVDEMSRLQPENLAKETDQTLYHLVKKIAAKVLSPLQLQILELSLSLRAYSPTIQMYQQIAAETSSPCATFVKIHGEVICSVAEIQAMIDKQSNRSSTVYKFDHLYADMPTDVPTVFLYSEIGKDKFQEFHHHLRKLAEDKKIQYIFRHYVMKPSERQARLSGYGVELAIKSTEYKAKDDTKVEGETSAEDKEDDDGEDEVQGFIFSKLRELYPDRQEDLKNFKSNLLDSSTELTPLKVWQLQDLSFQAAQKILSAHSADALKMLADLSQNFPVRAKSLVATTVHNDVRKEILKNQDYFERNYAVGSGESAMYLNGLPVDMEVYDIFTLLDIMSSEARIMEGLFALGFSGANLNRMIRLDLKSEFDSFALDIRHTAVKYVNDLETERRYKSWPTSIQDILRPTFPGMLRHVAKNIFHLVFMVDPTKEEGIELLKIAEAFNVHNAPIRIGVVFVVDFDAEVTGEMDAGVAIVNAFEYIRQDDDAATALSFMTDIYENVRNREITADAVISEFVKRHPDEEPENVFGASSEYDILRRAAKDFISKSGLSHFPQVMMNGVPMKKESLKVDNFEEGVVTSILEATAVIQKAAYDGTLHDAMDILDWLMEKDNVMPRLNSRVLSPAVSTLDFTENMDEMIYEDVDTFRWMSSKDMTSIMAQNIKYVSRLDEEIIRAVTIWIVADLETPTGRDLVYSALRQLKSSHELRVGIVFNPSDDTDSYISKAIYVAMATLENQLARSLVTKLVKEENVEELKAGTKKIEDLEVHGMDTKAYLEALEEQTTDFLKVHRIFASKVLKFPAGQRGLVTNGKVIGPFDENEEFTQQDIELQEKYIYQQSAKKIRNEVKKLGVVGEDGSDLLMKVAALLTSKTSSDSRKDLHYHGNVHSAVKIPSESMSPAFQIEAIVDPISTEAQKMAPILMVLKEVANVDIQIFMNSRSKLSDMPLKTFYRYVLEPTLQFKSDGSLTSGPMAKFVDLPQKSLLTLALNAPESWLVEAVRSPYDLDNILLEEVEHGVTGEFDLEYVLLEGHCHDAATGQPPRGLQFTLSSKNSPVVMDTIVMANLGYFQLKANPGVWHLQMREGRSAEMYSISEHEYTDTPEEGDDIVVTISNFKSKIIRVKVSKKPGMEDEDLLADEDEGDTGLWGSLSSTLTGSVKEEEKDATLNIFSLASGHLYERLLRIMILSVLKHTKTNVKFWFLKNYLSPTFKDFIPHMAEEYGFQYELVQYKWPRWLTKQKEKQRIIWGYKILFLDVLFPLDVKKFIFVDADQIVRTDLQELHDFDLQGAPYGYTPFCSDRKEMDGFRFWKSGYWASHLAGRKYHISALYVVDLKKFRRVAAGDRLRGQYQGLSQDPNSLANLDQDLPNNMIHQVKIKSLPQEWLWCATWCSEESKSAAKTIDLCNNPLTKEPKLQAAMRIVPEWKNYDYEIKVLWDKIYGTDTRFQIEYDPPELDSTMSDKAKDEL